MLIQKKLYFVVIFLLIMLSGCETYRANVEADAIIGNQLEILDSYKGSPYVKGYDSKPSQPYQNNAMTTAIIYRNLGAVKKLVSLGANRSTSIDYYYSGDPSAEFSYFDPRFIRSMSVPAVDLACIVFDLEIVDYLLSKFPDEKPNYSRCMYMAFSNVIARSGKEMAATVSDITSPYLPSTSKNEELNYISALVERGADVNVFISKNIRAASGIPEDITPGNIQNYQASLQEGYNWNFFKNLVENGLDPDSLKPWVVSAISSGGKRLDEAVIYLIENGLNPNLKGDYPLSDGIYRENGGSVRIVYKDISILHLAAFYSRGPIYKRLIEVGANRGALDGQGRIPKDYLNFFINNYVANRGNREAEVKRYEEEARIQDEKNASKNSGGFAKALALGIGAVAIGSLDVDSETAIQAMGAVSADILSDGKSSNTSDLYQNGSSVQADRDSTINYYATKSKRSWPAAKFENCGDEFTPVIELEKQYRNECKARYGSSESIAKQCAVQGSAKATDVFIQKYGAWFGRQCTDVPSGVSSGKHDYEK
ncbi:hypothetical protein [uncultured Zhongshania sp.]|uniref:hypothetical protein n=1 Tax=uncultured Zhongshania sp. TaxID=1642288 RepID=UPI0025FCA7B7|nr:hypothetical protein [uncultured Zhongshania sp.]